MSDDWRPGLSQNIEEDEELEDEHLVPPTPGQEDIDAASPSQDNASALSCLTSPTSGKRPLLFMGEPLGTLDFHTADDELMPYLAAAVSEAAAGKVDLIEDCPPGDELESGFEKALSNAAAASVGVKTTQWGTPPTSPLGAASSLITSMASQTTNSDGCTVTQVKTSIPSSDEYFHEDVEKKEKNQEGGNNGSLSQNPALLLSDDEEDDIIPPSPPSRGLIGTPTMHIPLLGSTSSAKRKHEPHEPGLYYCSPSKQPKMDGTSSSNVTTDSGEEKVIVNYDKLLKKDVEISPNRKATTPHSKPAFSSNVSKRIAFSSEDSSDSKDNKAPPNRLPYETELEDSDCEIIEDKNKSIEVLFEKPKIPLKNSFPGSSLDVNDSQELNLALTGLTQNENSQMSQSSQMSQLIDVESLSQSQSQGERPGQRLSQVEGPGQRLSQGEGPSQRLSQTVLPYGLTEEPDNFLSQEPSQSQSQSLLQMPDSVSFTCHDTLSSISKEGTQTQGFGSMQVSQMEDICQPAEFTQPPDIDTLLSFPIQKKNAILTSKSKDTVEKKNSKTSNGKGSRSTKNTEFLLIQNSEVILSQSQGCTPSKAIEETPCLKLPEISTPSSQEMPNTLEGFGSESVFQKVSKAVDKKRLTDKNDDHSKLSFESSYEKASDFEDHHGGSNNSSLIEISSGVSSAVTSPVKISQSSQSTPISSHTDQRILDTSKLFYSGKKDLSLSDKSQQVLVEESDSDEEGLMNRSKNKKAKSKVKEKLKNEQLEKIRKSSTPNTSHGLSPNISDESAHSYIQKDISSEHENSKSSHNTSAETIGGEICRADTQLLTDLGDLQQCTEEELISRGYNTVSINTVSIKKFIKESDNSIVYILEDEGLEKVFSHHEMKPLSRSGSGGSSNSNRRRVSDISSISRSSGYSGYLGDKSSSSDTSRRISTFSNNSARLSISSIATISPTRGTDEHQEHDENGIFAVPQSRAVKTNKSPITDEITFKDFPKTVSKGNQTDSVEESKEVALISDDKVGSGRGRGSRTVRGKAARGRAKAKGRGSLLKGGKYDQNDDSSTDSQDIAPLPKTPKRKVSPSKRKSKDVTKSPRKSKKCNENLSPPEELDIPDELDKILERCYSEMPLSEAEESAFMVEGGKDAEIQLQIVQNRVRHTNLEINMLVFARFTDNVYYSARLLKEDSNDRWFVEYTLDRYSHSVRDVHILPTVLLPRGQACAVRPDSDANMAMNDTGKVMGHLWEGKDLKHIIATDRGITLRVSHSHLVLTGDQIKRILEARLKYRSMVASPGSDVNFDNICPGKRRRAPLVPYSSPGSRKEDPNLDTSDATAGESEDLLATPRKSPSKPRGTGRGKRNKLKNLVTVTEESESEPEDAPGPSTPRGRGRPPTSPRTPKSSHKYKSTPEVVARKISDSPLPNRILEIQHEELPTVSPSPKKRGKSQSESKKMKMEDSADLPVALNSSLGPLPKKKDIFAGFIVLITDGKSSLRQQENEDDISEIPTLSKEHLTEQVCQGGGRVVDSFNEVEILLAEQFKLQAKTTPAKSRKNTRQKATSNRILLIANTFCRTAKYISCLAAGIPCVDFRWIIDSCSQTKHLDWKNYILPAGKTDDGEFEQKINIEIPIPSKVLLGTCVFLASSSNSRFKSLWHPLLVIAQAEVRDKPKNASQLNGVLDRSVSVILADSSIPDSEVNRAHQLKIPIVSTTWLIESIISVERLDYGHSEKYAHDFKSSLPESVQDQ